jgi:glycosyltransferase involved in cell wall biosynthesis
MDESKVMPQAPNHAGTDAPRVTFALFAYNQEAYIREAVEATLAQVYPNLEIVISDDCSTDGTFRVITESVRGYAGPHTVLIRKNERNMGLASHISCVMRLVSGELVVAAAGDDVSYPFRTQRLVDQWLIDGKRSGSIFSYVDSVDHKGRIRYNIRSAQVDSHRVTDRDVRVAEWFCVGTLGCAHAWSRDVFDVFGDLDNRIIHEDISIPLRSMMVGSVTYVHEPLVLYRLNQSSLSKISYTSASERFAKMARYWASRVANYSQFDKDLAHARLLGIIDHRDASWLLAIVDRHRAMASFNHRFFSADRTGRLKLILSAPDSVSVARRVKCLAIALFPSIYGVSLPSIR